MTTRRVVAAVVFGLAGVVFLAGIIRLNVIGRQGFDIETGEGVPVTLFLPGELDEEGLLPVPPPRERPPVVVVAHGFSGDRGAMWGISRALAANGYAAAALDFRGHGGNREPFTGDIVGDLVSVIDAMRDIAFVDGERVALLGHSMGASAVLGAGARDRRVDAVVAMSGTRPTSRRPRNVLLEVASGDPRFTRLAAARLGADLAGRDVPSGRTAGAVKSGKAVRFVEIEGVDHLTILGSQRALRETVRWLDATFGIRREDPITPIRSRLPAVALPLAAAVVLIAGVGMACGRAAPAMRPGAGVAIPAGLGLLAVAQALAVPFVPLAGQGIVPLRVGDAMTSLLAVAAGFLLVLRWAAVRRGAPPVWVGFERSPFAGIGRSLAPAGAAVAAIYLLLAPVLGALHRVAPTPERLVAFVLTTAFFFPFFAVAEPLVRRGRTFVAALGAIGSRVVALAVMLAGASLGVLPGVVMLGVPLLFGVFLLVEVFAVSAYSVGRNTVLIALVESAWLGWLLAATLPITI